MGRELYEKYPIYASAIDKADAHLISIGASFSLLEELQKNEETTQINAAHLSQPSCTAIQLALTDLLQSWGVKPSSVTGHSSGEIGAAYAAGIIDFEDAMTIAYHRGRLIPILKKKFPALDGCMMAVGAGKDEISSLLDRVPESAGQVKIACINSPSSVTLSGDADAIAELQKIIEEVHPGLFARKLQIDTAYHSHHMNLVAKEYTESLSSLKVPKLSDVRFFSSLLGRLADSSEIEASYWVQNLTCAVRFDEAVQSMCQPVDGFKTGVNFLLELGPHAALQGPIKQILKALGNSAVKIAYASALSRKRDAVQTVLALAGTLFVKGVLLNMGAINFPKPLAKAPAVLTDMPRYPWNHQSKYVHQSRITQIHKFQKDRRSDIIGVLASYSNDIEPTWRNIIRLDEIPWLRHHQIQSLTIFPISGFVAMALEAVAQKASWKNLEYDGLEVRDLTVVTPAMLSDEDLEMTITLRKPQQSTVTCGICDEFRICSWSKSKGWTEHCKGVVATMTAVFMNEVDGTRALQAKEARLKSKVSTLVNAATKPVKMQQMYEQLSSIGVSYGTSFQGLHECRASKAASLAHITLADTAEDMPNHYESDYILHPTLLEQLIEMYWPVLDAGGALDTVHLPSSIGKISVSSKLSQYLNGPGSKLQALCEPSSALSNIKSNRLSMFVLESLDATHALISVENLVISPILEREMGGEAEGYRELCYKLIWEPALQPPVVSTTRKEPHTNGDSPVSLNGVAAHATNSGVVPIPHFDAEIVIVHGDTALQQSLVANLSSGLTGLSGLIPTTGLLSTVDGKDKLCIFLCEIDQPLLATLDSAQFEALQRLLMSVQGILWVVRGAYANSKNPDSNMVAGLSRTLRSEGTLMNFTTLDLDSDTQLAESDVSKTIIDVFSASLGTNKATEETEFMERGGLMFTPRIINDNDMNEYVHNQVQPSATEPAQFTNTARPLQGFVTTPGALDTMTFDDSKIDRSPLADDEVEIQVKAVGLTPYDIQAAMGHLSVDALGMECSGIITSVGYRVSNVMVGDRVAAITSSGSLSTVTRAHDRFLLKLPDNLSFKAAATIPIAYCTAYRGLVDLAAISEGESVLIHDAASAVGQAAIAVAQVEGAKVFVTVDNAEMKVTMREEYGIPEERIFYNGSDAFSSAVLEATSNLGVDVVLGSFSTGELLNATWACLAHFGRFVDIGARDGSSNTGFGHIPFEKSPTILSVNIAALALQRPQTVERTLAKVSKLLRYEKIRPAHPITSFGILETTAALQVLQSGDVHGKLVIVPREDELVQVSDEFSG
jgi:NADPH:quinone reductase-like Zn-dependent oxidoreductase/malonyl CoA-acyl carrier protein transacylase